MVKDLTALIYKEDPTVFHEQLEKEKCYLIYVKLGPNSIHTMNKTKWATYRQEGQFNGGSHVMPKPYIINQFLDLGCRGAARKLTKCQV